MKKLFLYSTLALCLLTCSTESYSQTIPFDSNRWEIIAKEGKVIDYLGRKSLVLQSGYAIVKDSQFTDGVIEFDIALTGELGFMGAIWRVQDAGNFEEFYLRPHHSGNPDANQYQPVFNGLAAWQLYYGEGYGALSRELVSTSPAAPRVYVIASDPHGEGAMIAAMAARENRPGSMVLRGSKVLTSEDWFGRPIEDRFPTKEEVSRLLDRGPVDVVILDDALPEGERSAYQRRLQAVVTGAETEWREAGAFPRVRAGQAFPHGLRVYVRRSLASPASVRATVDRTLLADLMLPRGVR